MTYKKSTNFDVSNGTKSPRIDVDISSSIQSTKPCEPDNSYTKVVYQVYSLLKHNQDICDLDKAVIEIQLISGCRIGSVLLINNTDINTTGQISIPAEKGGLAVLCTPCLYPQVWQAIRLKKIVLSQVRDRFYYYHLYKKYGIMLQLANNINSSVTHALRHAYIANSVGLNLTERERANAAGQQSTKSQESYIPTKRKQNRTK